MRVSFIIHQERVEFSFCFILTNNNLFIYLSFNKFIIMQIQTETKPIEPNPEILKKNTGPRSLSQQRLLKLQKVGFQLEAEKIRKENTNKNLLREFKMKSKSNKKILPQLTQHQVGNFLKPTKIISATAHKWAIYDFFSAKYLRGYRARDSHPLNVFSKLLVFCAMNTLVQKYKLDTSRFETIVTESMLKMHKGDCLLKVDDIVSLQDLLHLMIMSESEIYETILAVNVGAFLQKKRKKQYYSVFDAHDKYMKQHLKHFYQLVNSYCQLLKLENIRYLEADPQLRKEKNKCSAADVAVLSIECLKIPLFMSILAKLKHTVNIKFIDSEGKLTQSITIIESKAILNKFIPYSSVCRNWEENAFMDSHCSIYYQDKQDKHRPVVVVLLGSYGPIDREKDIQQIVQWYLKHSQSDFVVEKQSPRKIATSRKDQLPLSQVVSTQMQKQIQKKLKLQEDKQFNKKYDHAIAFKSKNVRIKTQQI